MTSIYFYPDDFICDISEVRRLARNVLTADFTNEQIESYAYKAYSIIRTLTDKDDWDPNDREFGAMQGFNTDIAADWIKSHFGKTQEERTYAKSSMESTIEALKEIIDNMDTATGAEALLIARTPFKSWNLNPDVEVPRGNLIIS